MRAQGAHDFSPASQDACAAWLCVDMCGAGPDIEAGNLHAAIDKCGGRWASLPSSTVPQPHRDYAFCEQTFTAAGGALAIPGGAIPPPAAATSIPSPGQSATAQPSETTGKPASADPSLASSEYPHMGAFLAFLPAILQSIPQLLTVFGHGDPQKLQQQAGAVKAVTDALIGSTGATNLQDAIEKIQTDPEAKQAAQQAITDQWYRIAEVGTGGMDAARKAAADPNQIRWWLNPVMVVTLLLLPLIYGLCYLVLQPGSDYSEASRMSVAMFVLGNVVGGIVGLWFGMSYAATKKDVAP